jgi:hypothetical protein
VGKIAISNTLRLPRPYSSGSFLPTFFTDLSFEVNVEPVMPPRDIAKKV